jgi:hypothetical protein
VLSDEWNGPWTQIDGVCEVLDAAEGLDAFVEYYRNIAGEHPDWSEYRQAMLDQGKSLLRITPTRWVRSRPVGFPPASRERYPTSTAPQPARRAASRSRQAAATFVRPLVRSSDPS